MNVDSSLAIRIECLSCVVFDEKDERKTTGFRTTIGWRI